MLDEWKGDEGITILEGWIFQVLILGPTNDEADIPVISQFSSELSPSLSI